MEETSPIPASEPVINEPEDQPRLAKFLCSFGGSVMPRPLDGRLRYVGGETRIVTVPHDISFSSLLQRMREIFEGADVMKYQQPDEDLDALVSVVNDDDVINMMEEYDKLIASGEAFTRLRIFLFSQNALEGEALNSPSTLFDAFSERESERRYVDALNCLIDPKSGLNSPDMEGSMHGNISLRHLNVPRPPVYGPKFSDVDSPYNGTGNFSPGFHNLQSQELFRDLPVGAEDFNEKSGYLGHYSRGDHLADSNGAFCEHFMHTPYHQKSGCLAPDIRYLDPPHPYYTGHGQNGLNHQCSDCYRNNVENNEYHHYYRNDTHGHDRMWAPHNQINYCYDNARANRVPDPFTQEGSRVNHLYPQGNIRDLHENTHIYNPQIATDVGTAEMFHNTAQQVENPSQQYNQAAMYNLESLYQVPQNLPPIPSLRRETQVHMLASASPSPYDSPNAVGVNPSFVRVAQDGTPNGGINPLFVRITQEGTPNGGPNPVFVRGASDGNHIGGGINPILVKATPDGTPNGGVNPVFVRGTPDGTPNGGGIKPSFMIGTPEDSPRLSGVGAFEQIPSNWVGFSDNCSQKFPGHDFCAGMPDYGQHPGSRLNPNFSIQENSSQCQMMPPAMSPLITGTVVTETALAGTLVTESVVNGTPVSENLVGKNPITVAPITDGSSKKGSALSFGIPLGNAVNRPNALLEPHNMPVYVEEKYTEGAPAENHVRQNGDVMKLRCCPDKQLADSIKSVTLEGAKAVGPKESSNDDEYNLHEVTSENGNMDPEDEVESSESEGMSRIESTTAEQEAFAKGLQTIKNEDLEEIRELGHGTYGTVYYGKWRGSDVAIKRIKASCFAGRPSERDRLIADFWKEAQILGSLHHPNVVSFYGVVRDGPDGGLATVTEYMVNGSLKQFLYKKDRTVDRRKRILLAMDAAFGMEYLHSKNIVHFDVKCENLLVNMKDSHRPVCKIGDLGLSKVKHQTLVSGGVRGTLPWMAPELLDGKESMVTEKVDVYSFGICMWEILTGEEPYADMKGASIIGGIVNGTLRPQIPSWCDPEWKALMQRCWSTDPKERPSFTEISQKLRQICPPK
ncbi:hypothetical protein LUZ61_002808 [Rhynchospora tenuis]|uniref:Protein kinase domain-containing protein n=1 Tax=Rhynchospora tenuis TaxID=198213 RepID=A0AAD6ES15_9POAL|nr:hypothetical protein LUZ61_002808 [Rhynchospora tenuis]